MYIPQGVPTHRQHILGSLRIKSIQQLIPMQGFEPATFQLLIQPRKRIAVSVYLFSMLHFCTHLLTWDVDKA